MVALCTTVLHTVCIFVCFVWNVLLWHVHVQTGIRQTDKQTLSVTGGREVFFYKLGGNPESMLLVICRSEVFKASVVGQNWASFC